MTVRLAANNLRISHAILEPKVTSLLHAKGLPAIVVTLAFTVLARGLGAVTYGGAVAGMIAAMCLMFGAGIWGFLPLLTVFALTAFATRWGYRRKERLGVAERSRGRTSSQVFANLGAAAMCALPVAWLPHTGSILLVGAMAALAEAAADTVSSEIGQASAHGAYLITDFRSVPIGTNGAVSLEGTLAGCIAASLVAWVSSWFGLVDWNWTPVIALSGVGGMIIDSFMGAAWENVGKLGNDAVNFVSTVFAADAALIAAMVAERWR